MTKSARRLRLEYQCAALRVRLSLLTVRLAEMKAGFREDQSRGPDGRWNGGGGSVIVTRKDKTGNPRIDAKTDQLVDTMKEVVEKVGPGSGAAYGISVHAEAAKLIRSLDLPGIGIHGVEQSFSAEGLVRYGLNDSVRTDIILRDGRTAAAPIMAVWDIKTGNADLSPKMVKNIRDDLGIDEDVPVIEIHVSRGIRVKADRSDRRSSGAFQLKDLPYDDGRIRFL